MRPVVALTANDRPHYLAEALETWSRVRGVGDAHLIFRCEPGHPEVAELAASAADFAGEVTVIVNEQKYGALGNPWHCFKSGFATGAGFVILGEDDSLVADDILEWFAWCAARFAAREKVLAVCALRPPDRPSAGTPLETALESRFAPTIWGTWRDRWENLLRGDWDFDYSRKGWDWRITEHWLRDEGHVCAMPCQSRSQVSGEFGGTHLQPGQMYRDHLSPCFHPHYEPGEFTEVQ